MFVIAYGSQNLLGLEERKIKGRGREMERARERDR